MTGRSGCRPRAILFDLFGTLVPAGSRVARDRVSREVATCLGVEPEALAVAVRASFDARVRGRLGDLRQTLESLAVDLGGCPSQDAVAEAVELRLAMTRDLHRRTWAVPVLVELASRGIPCGLVSDCSAETPAVWDDGPLAPHLVATSFSCVTGHRKPEPEAYCQALGSLGVRADDCWYVGDGGSRELTGAQALGMRAFRLGRQIGDPGDPVDPDADWSGPVLGRLEELLEHLA